MNKILATGAIIVAGTLPHLAYGLSGLWCEVENTINNCPIITESPVEDSATCKNICNTCPGTITLPTGYVSNNTTNNKTATKIVTISCPTYNQATGQYITYCSCKVRETISCENGYSGTATFDGTTFSGCTQGGGIVIGAKCLKGEYTNLKGTCVKCPSFNGVAGTTALAGDNSILDCYIPSGNTFTDTTGTYTLTDDCYYGGTTDGTEIENPLFPQLP